MTNARWLLALAPFALLAACGGQSFTEGDDSAGEGGEGGSSAGKGGSGSGAIGSGGKATAGTGSSGTANGGTGTAGTGFAGTGFAGNPGTGGSVCCTAAPVCPPGEREVLSADYCPPGSPCHSVSVCCSTIWCTSDVAQCDAYPTCDSGDTQLMGECPPDGSCYTRSLCGTTIWCLDRTCNPETEYNRIYLASNCEGVDWDCPTANTKPFVNECGCGCEQPDDCPAHLGCYNPIPPPEEADARPGTGGTSSSGAAPFPSGGAASIPEPPAPCTAEALQRCPFSATY